MDTGTFLRYNMLRTMQQQVRQFYVEIPPETNPKP